MIKKYTSTILLLLSFLSNAQITWLSFEEAINQQSIKPKKILIDFYAKDCAPCQEMASQTFEDPAIINLINDHFYAVKYKADGDENVKYLGKDFSQNYISSNKSTKLNQFTQFMNVSSIPSTVFLDESAQPIINLNGFITAKELHAYLTMIYTEEYKKVKSRSEWEAYTRKLHSKIRK